MRIDITMEELKTAVLDYLHLVDGELTIWQDGTALNATHVEVKTEEVKE